MVELIPQKLFGGLMEIKDGYSLCFNEWALDNEIKNELGLLLIISSLCAEKGYCYASNEYFAQKFITTEVSISRKLKKLESKKYITIEYKKRGCEVIARFIRLTKMLTDDYQNCKSTINENVKDNNISIKNININKEINNKEKFEYFDSPALNKAFKDYVEMRKAIKKPMTLSAQEIAIKKLHALSDSDESKMIAILEQSVMNSWQGLFPLKEDKRLSFQQKMPNEIINTSVPADIDAELNEILKRR